MTASSEVLKPASPPPPPPAARQGQLSWRSRLSRLDVKFAPYLMVAPFFILFLAFGTYPLLYNFYVSFQKWHLIDQPHPKFYGFAQYERLLGDDQWWNALKNTIALFVFSSVPQLFLALCLAAILNRKLRAQTLFRMGVLLPYITPLTASTFIFFALFERDTGLVNAIGTALGAPRVWWEASTNPPWFPPSWIALCTLINWKWTGYNTLIYLAAMQAIPKDLYEAATVDGAGPWRQFWRLTVPLIRPTLLFTIIMTTIGGMQLFTEPMLFQSNPATAAGGSAGQYRTVQMYIYDVAWTKLNLGYSGALSVALFLVILIFVGISSVLTMRGGRSR
jgi:cellobiose transport system permease protein